MMLDFNSILDAAQRLDAAERLRLINVLWDSVPSDVEASLHEEWGPELERRVAAIDAGEAALTPWSTIRTAALSRLDDGTSR